ncbi:MAG: GNAT family N-acetyltransferase [Alphaproteobacteria bacterium]|nr:GNAT family N-acetyltransferase [Alphaproteobacteria bacterium]
MNCTIRLAEPRDAAAVGGLVDDLLQELAGLAADMERRARFVSLAEDLLQSGAYWAFLAEAPEGEAPIGVLTLNRCLAIYAGGAFGEICELYVAPERRSRTVAAQLVDAAFEFARAQGWSRLEVGAPDQPAWSATLRFYQRIGFQEVGPRLKRLA